ncbi:MAG: sugar phosphate isomerase/epimerase family protein [Vicinamibacterales bacterium]
MSRRFSLAYLTIPGTPPDEQVRIAAQCGYDLVSLRTIPMGLPGEPDLALDKDPGLFRAVRSALRESGMSLFDIELVRIREDLAVGDFEPALEKAVELGAENVLSSIWSRDKGFYLEQFGRVCDMAARYGMNVNLEFVTFTGVADLAAAVEVLEAVRRPNARLTIDTLHAHRSRVTPGEIARVDPALFGYVHLCDGPAPIPPLDDPSMIGVARGGRLYAGEGGIDIAGMIRAMPELPLSIELPNDDEMKKRGRSGHARRCLETAKAYLAAHGIV